MEKLNLLPCEEDIIDTKKTPFTFVTHIQHTYIATSRMTCPQDLGSENIYRYKIFLCQEKQGKSFILEIARKIF